MQVEEKAALLRIFIGENDRFGQRPLYEAIVLKGAGAGACRGDCSARTDGLWPFESPAYR